jgi:hypothetical protein
MMITTLRHFLCWLVTRHKDRMRAIDRGRLCLKCVCGYTSPGWKVGKVGR